MLRSRSGWPTWRPWPPREGHGSQPLRLFAKAEALLKAEAAAFSLPARDHYERAHARARETLGEEDYQAAAAAGRALTVEQALAEAEAVLEREHDGSAAATSAP